VDEAEFERLYRPWDPLDPAEAQEFLADFPGPWWVVGGWAVEAFSGVHREHHDVDVAIFKYDVPALLDLVGDRYDVWSISSGSLRPINETWPEPPPEAGQVWLREHAQAPWVIDLLINEDRDGQSVSRREEWSAPLEEVTWVADDGIRYQNPEVVLHHKARGDEERDRADRDAAWPLMDDAQRAWLHEAVLRVYGADHPWLAWMDGQPTATCRT
jgi:Aminoglycoside-2''-adenylyltransferase